MGLPMQQNRRCDRSDVARCTHLGDARDLRCRIPLGVLDLEPPGRTPHTFAAIRVARLHRLACVFTGRLACLLASLRWFALPRDPFRNHYLFCDAATGESRSNATEYRMSEVGMVAAATPQRVGKVTALPADICAFGDRLASSSEKPIHR
jgi:hypothetical protein